jgi:hypothetical protein
LQRYGKNLKLQIFFFNFAGERPFFGLMLVSKSMKNLRKSEKNNIFGRIKRNNPLNHLLI